MCGRPPSTGGSNTDHAAGTTDQLSEQLPLHRTASPALPLARLTQVDGLAARILSQQQRLRVLVLNASVFYPGPYSTASSTAAEGPRIEQTRAVNFFLQVGRWAALG